MPGREHDTQTAAAELIREMIDDPLGDVAPSTYDTARLVSLAPWLDGHAARLDFLCDTQGRDGAWGAPDGYGIVPTLSATEALIACLRRPPGPERGIDPGRLAAAAARGLAALRRWLERGTTVAVPDTIAVELVVPAMVAAINRQLDAEAVEPSPHSERWSVRRRLGVPAGFDPDAPAALRARIDRAEPVPQTWWASVESIEVPIAGIDRVRPVDGAVACSPAATAAWLAAIRGVSSAGSTGTAIADAVRYLDRLQARGGGPVPGVTPITYFEWAWVLSGLADVAPGRPVAPELLDGLAAALGPHGAPAAPGLPPDCDDTAVVLTALARHGRSHRPDCLLRYRTDDHFACFPAERTPSTSTNAHALEAVECAVADRPAMWPRLAPAITAVSRWLLDAQDADGSWQDKWHASPFYATFCCVRALGMRVNNAHRDALRRAVDWVLAMQRSDGSWGRWTGTVEETAYAVQILASGGAASRLDMRAAVAAAAAYLRAHHVTAAHPGLWHAKDLYAPTRVIRAARLGALAAARTMLINADAGSFQPAVSAAALRLPVPRSAPTQAAQSESGSPSRPR
jgi:hypothetical protein